MSILRRKMKDAAARKRASAAGPEKALLSGKTLTLPLALEDGRVPGLLQNIAFFAGVLVVLGVVWASVAQIRELAVGHGEVVPVDAVQNAHHLEGGIVEDPEDDDRIPGPESWGTDKLVHHPGLGWKF